MSQNARVGKRLPVINNVTVTRTVLQSQDIGSWKSAINQARDIYVPRRKLLQELYENIVLDGHLQGVMAKRTSHITNKKVAWVSRNAEEGGKEYDAIEANILRTPWFHDLLEGAMSQVFYGTTVLELVPKGGEVSSVEVVPRANVVPELSMVLENANVWGIGINYLEDPLYSKWLIPVGKVKDYGGLMVAAQYAIWKRGGYADWAQYMELFGMPYRIGKYNPYDEHSRKKLDEALRNMGAAGHIVIPDGSSLEFLFPTNNSGTVDVYDKLIERANQEMSKLFLGNTLTTDAGERGARSLGEVHAKTEEDVVLSDMKRIEFLLNWELTERLLAMGYPVQNGDFRFEETTVLPMNEQIEVDMKVAQQVDIPEEYWYTRYGIPRPDSGAKVVIDDPEEEEEEEDDDVPPGPPAGGQKKKDPPVRAEAAYRPRLSARLDRYYGLDRQPPQAAKPKGKGAPKHILDRIAEAVRNGEVTGDSVDPALMRWIASEFTKHILGSTPVGDDSAPPHITPEEERQIQVFSGFKTNAQLRAATDALYNEHGRMVPFAEFKRRIRAIDATYNVRYLKAEYELARANRAGINAWKDMQAMKEVVPFAKYSTVGDDRVREAHAAMDGVIKHLDDPFWDVWWPPNGWNCRCTVIPMRSDKGGKEVPANVVPPKTMFANNVGKNGALFPKGHPYERQASQDVQDRVQELADAAMIKAGQRSAEPAFRRPNKNMRDRLHRISKDLGQDAAIAFDAIAAVHSVREMPLFSMVLYRKMVDLGTYHSKSRLVRINPRGTHIPLTIVHELAHHLDWHVLGHNGYASREARGKLKAVLAAVEASAAVTGLRAIVADRAYVLDGQQYTLTSQRAAQLNDLLEPEELFARAYAQYIAVRSGNSVLLEQVSRILASKGPQKLRQWEGTDFDDIANAFDQLFNAPKWKPLK